MDILFYRDILEFQSLALPLLKSQCPINSLKLGILQYFSNHTNEPKGPVFALCIKHDAVVAVFVQTRTLYFFAQNDHFTESIHGVIEEFVARQIKIHEVMGHGNTALLFAEAWKEQTLGGFQFAGKDYLYELQHIRDTKTVTGIFQRAVLQDIPDLIPLFRDYYREDLGTIKTDRELEQSIAEQLAEYEIYLWYENGIKSMVTAMLPYDSGVELANVFTPQEYRKKGYAAACIAEVCRSLLQRYARVVLFVDHRNIAANSLYRKLGFQLVDEMSSYTLLDAEVKL